MAAVKTAKVNIIFTLSSFLGNLISAKSFSAILQELFSELKINNFPKSTKILLNQIPRKVLIDAKYESLF